MTDTQLSDAQPIRYLVSGMDCAKDAARIERAAQTVGIAPEAVMVSAATHIMTLYVSEGLLPKIEEAVATTGYGFARIEGDDDAQVGKVMRTCEQFGYSHATTLSATQPSSWRLVLSRGSTTGGLI